MTDENQNGNDQDGLKLNDGRKVTSLSQGGESYSFESTEQAARGKSAEIQAEIDEIKLNSLRRGIRVRKMR